MKLSYIAKGLIIFKKMINKIYDLIQIRKNARASIIAITAMMLCSGYVLAEDLMASGQEVVNDTFGADSSIAKWIILAEVIVGIITYIKTKNMFLLFGIAVVIVFTTIGFSLAG